MPHKDLLSIIDEDGGVAMRNMSRRDADVEIRVKGGIPGFVNAMDDLLAKRFTFQRAVFTTHGNSGMIFFDSGAIRAGDIENVRLRGYDRLFPDRANTRILFAGCNVAEGDKGWGFLDAAARGFLGSLGAGLVMGYTSVGFAIPQWFIAVHPVLWGTSQGHVVHPWGNLRTVWMIHGRIVGRFAE